MATQPEFKSFLESQPLLWLPRWSSSSAAFCSLNTSKLDTTGKDISKTLEKDANGCPKFAPYPSTGNRVMTSKQEKHYSILPISRTLTRKEIEHLGNQVSRKLGRPEGYYDTPTRSLKSSRTPTIILILKEMEISMQWVK